MNRPILIAVIGAFVSAAAGFAAIHFLVEAAPMPVAPPPPVPVVATTVAQHDVPIYLRGVGTVVAYNNVIVRSQITGQLVNIAFTQGQAVHKGDLLAEIDPRPFQAQLDQATANRDRDQAQVVNAQANLDRYVPLAEKGWATQQLVDTQRAQLAQLKAIVASDEAVIEQARTNLSYTRLIAPIDGVTGIRQVDIGNIIHPTDVNGLVDVTQIEPISLIFTLPQTDLTRIQPAMAKGALTVDAYSQDDKVELDEGKLDLVDNQIIQTTGTIRLRASFPNAKRQLWPGELVNARLLVETRHNGLTVPAEAIQQGPNGAFAWAVSTDGAAQIRPVTVAQISDGQALIDSGLEPNMTVVTAGQYRLQTGAQVRLLQGDATKNVVLQSAVEQAIP